MNTESYNEICITQNTVIRIDLHMIY